MSEGRDILREVVLDRASSTTDSIRNLRTGAWFSAEIEPVEPIVAQAELGEDAREVIILHVTSDEEASRILSQDRVQVTQFGSTETYKIVKRRDNVANIQTAFWAVQVASIDTP